MRGKFAVRRASLADAPALAALHKTSFAKPWDEAAMAVFLAAPETLCLIGSVAASEDAAAAGLLIARKAADEAEILTFCVAPSYRRLGLGRALLAAAISELCRAGAKTLFLEVEEGNEEALLLYRSFGAASAGKRARYYESGKDAAILSLAL